MSKNKKEVFSSALLLSISKEYLKFLKGVEDIRKHANIYYAGGDESPLISDEEYDKRLKALEELKEKLIILMRKFTREFKKEEIIIKDINYS